MRALLPFIITPLILALVGCVSPQTPTYDEIEEPPQSEDISPEELYERTAALFSRPENLGLDFYSPGYYRSALDALEDAETAIQGVHQSTISPVRALIAARKLLEKAQETRTAVDRNLRELVKHRNLLIELNAPKWQEDDWLSVSEEIEDLVTLIENGDIKTAISQEPGVRKDMYDLEINTLLASALDQSRSTLRKARKADAEKYSPTLYNSADILIDDTEIYIRSNFRDRTGIAQQAERARLEAERAYKTALDSKHLLSLNEQETEQYLIELKKLINSVVLISQEDPLPPSTVNEALNELVSITQSKLSAETLEQPTTDNEVFVSEESADDAEIQVLEVLDSLHMQNESNSDQTVEFEQEEQSFDDVEFIE